MIKETKATLKDLLALCDILDEFENFNKEVKIFLLNENRKNLLYRLRKYFNGQFCFSMKKIKKFYENNKSTIDKINKFTDLDCFIENNYDQQGNISSNFNYFYQYISNNKNSLSNIKSLLQKLVSLGFSRLEFDEKEDFTNKTYGIDPYFYINFTIYYLDNIEVIPTYDSYIEYKTTNSNYQMKLFVDFETSLCCSSILVNSLLFDPSRLPNKITKEDIFDYILKLKLNKEETRNLIKDSVDLRVSVYDLETQLKITAKTIRDLNNVKNKKDLLDTLANIKKDIERLKSLEAENDHSIIQEDSNLTSDILDREKKLQLSRKCSLDKN